MSGGSTDNTVGMSIRWGASQNLLRWSHDRATTEADLTRAIHHLKAAFDQLTPSPSQILAYDYSDARLIISASREIGVFPVDPIVDSAVQGIVGEPEFSLRVLDLVVANQLLGIDLPGPQRLEFVAGHGQLFDLASSRQLPMSGDEISALCDQAWAMQYTSGGPFAATILELCDRGTTLQRNLLAVLAIELFVRHHGELPRTLDQIVGDVDDEWLVDPFSQNGSRLIFKADDKFALVYTLGPDGADDGYSLKPGARESSSEPGKLVSGESFTEGYRIPLSSRSQNRDVE
jgi:hypothetical protein